MAWVAGIAMVLGGIMNAVGGAKAADASAQAARGNAESADQEANQLERNASLSVSQAQSDETNLRIMARKQFGTLRSTVGASGLQQDGSALDILAESAATAEHDAANIRMAGQQKSQDFQFQANQRRKYADLLRRGADATQLGGMLSAGGTLLSSTAHAYSTYNDLAKSSKS